MKKQTTLKQDLEKCLLYCKEQNGLPYCKNCGLDESMLNKVDSKIDEIISEVARMRKKVEPLEDLDGIKLDDKGIKRFVAVCLDHRQNSVIDEVIVIINNKKQV